LGMMGWSHGGFITAHNLFREGHPFRAGAAIVPVTNLIFRLSITPRRTARLRRGGGNQGLPFENVPEYIRRSPVFQPRISRSDPRARSDERLRRFFPRKPAIRVHTARAQARPGRDEDLHQSAAGSWWLRAHVQPSRQCYEHCARRHAEQIDSWSRTWTFFEWNLRPRE
jgi:hypothetical protein